MRRRASNERRSASRSTALLIALLVIGLAFGLLVNWGRQMVTGSAVAEEEYVALVAALYGREHLIGNAQERLMAAGFSDPGARVSEIAREFPDKYPRRQATAASLQELAEALHQSGSPQPSSPGPGRGPTEELALDWLTLALLAVIAVVLTVGVFLTIQSVRERRRTRSPSRLRFSTAPAGGRRDHRPSHWKPVAEVTFEEGLSEVVSDARPMTAEAVSEAQPLVVEAISEPRPLVAGISNQPLASVEAVSEARPLVLETVSEPRPLIPTKESPPEKAEAASVDTTSAQPSAALPSRRRTAPSSQVPPAKPQVSTAPPESAGSRPAAGAPRPASPLGRAGGVAVFHCHYHRGDDPYDSTHSVNDPTSRVPVGACGVSSALNFGESGGCCGFSVWLQDYVADDEIASLGLVSRWAETAKARQVRSWASRERLQTVLVPSEGLTASLETTNLRASVGVDRVGYWEDPGVPENASFAHLRVTFRISLKR